MALVSFIIPAHNEEDLLGRTLTAIQEATRGLTDATEVIVVDDSSTDRTAEIAREHGAQVVSAQCRQIAGSRNAGAKEAKGGYFIFVDADTSVTAAAVRAAVTALREGAVGGGCVFRFDGRVTFLGKVLLAVGEPLYRTLRLASGCFLFCTREAFQATGGFDETLFAAEETVLSRALHRQGRFVILREQVITSGRKLRTFTTGEILSTFLRVIFSGFKAVRRREGLDIWYGERRHELADEKSSSGSKG